MIYICCSLRKPWYEGWRNIRTWSGRVKGTKHKFWEIQLGRCNYFLRTELSVTTQEDHAGIEFEVGFLNYFINFHVYDHRHWNDFDNCFHDVNHRV